MKRLLLILLVSSLSAFITYSIYLLQGQSSTARLDGVDIVLHRQEGVEPFMDEYDVLQELRRKGLCYEDVPIDSIDVGLIERQLRENPLFENVEVYITIGSRRMKVEVKQRVAYFLAYSDDGVYYVSAGRGIVPLNPNYAVYVPIVTGRFTPEEACTYIFDLVEVIKENPYFRDYFGQIHYDPTQGLILVPRLGNVSLILGHRRDYSVMLEKYRVFAEQVLPRVGGDVYAYLHLAYKDQVVAGRRAGRKLEE